jgi:hypothetical protein
VFGGPLAATRAFAHVAAADVAPDAIWGEHGAAARIAASLAHVSRRAFRHREFDVTHYGARSCATVAQTSPYPSAKSPVTPGADGRPRPARSTRARHFSRRSTHARVKAVAV